MVPVMMRAKVDKLMELKNEDNQYKKYDVCTECLRSVSCLRLLKFK